MYITGLSASGFQTHDWCAWRFFMTQVLGMEDPSGPAAIIGNVAHKVLEILSRASIVKHDKKSKIWDVEYLWKIAFDHYFNLSPEESEGIKTDKLIQVAKGIHDILGSQYTPIRDNTISAEAKFNFAMTDPSFIVKKNTDNTLYLNVRGRIDRVDKLDEETIEIIDYKSGTRNNYESKEREKKDSVFLREEIQPRMYHLAAKELYPWAKNILVTFVYITDGGPVTIAFCDNDMIDTKEMLRKKLQAIKADDDPQRTISWKCNNFCSFGKNGTCDEIWAEKNEVGIEFIKNKYTILNYKRKRRS